MKHISIFQHHLTGIFRKLEACGQDAHDRGLNIEYMVLLPLDLKEVETLYPHITFVFIEAGGKGFLNKVWIRIKQFRALAAICASSAGVIRYPGADPITFLLLRKTKQCYAEHHSLILNELRIQSLFRYVVEKTLSPFVLRRFKGHVGVTGEILEDVATRAGANRELTKVICNPYLFPENADTLVSLPSAQGTGFVVAANIFMPWHGVEEAISDFSRIGGASVLHVVGDVADTVREQWRGHANVVFYGKVNQVRLREIYAQCVFAFNSYRLDLIGMHIGSTLKLREYFAHGLIVISGQPDAALPAEFPYLVVRNDKAVLPFDPSAYLSTSKADVFEAAKSYLDVKRFNALLLSLA